MRGLFIFEWIFNSIYIINKKPLFKITKYQMVDGSYPKIDYVMESEGLEKVCKYALGMSKDHPSNPHRYEVRERKSI